MKLPVPATIHLISIQKIFLSSKDSMSFRSCMQGTRNKDHYIFITNTMKNASFAPYCTLSLLPQWWYQRRLSEEQGSSPPLDLSLRCQWRLCEDHVVLYHLEVKRFCSFSLSLLTSENTELAGKTFTVGEVSLPTVVSMEPTRRTVTLGVGKGTSLLPWDSGWY